MEELNEGDLVLCIVERIAGTTIFVKIENLANGLTGTIITSEIAPGRIRNIRDYVVPNKKIVCKILNINHGNVNLSLRRVTAKDKKEFLEKIEKEKNSFSILKSILKEKAEEVAGRIREKNPSLLEFLQNAKENPSLLEEYIERQDAEKIIKILKEKKEKQVEVKKEFSLHSELPNGITLSKKILLPYKEISYLAAGRFIIKIKAGNYKEANQKIKKITEDIEKNAKKDGLKFEVLNE